MGGLPGRHRKKWRAPYHPWKRDLLMQELELVGRYGLRNKRELWRVKAEVSRVRRIIRGILSKPREEQERIGGPVLARLKRLGVLPPDATFDDVLDLKPEQFLERRIQTIVFKKGLARTIHQARQMVVHGHIAIGDKIVWSPGYLVSVDEEPLVRYSPKSPFNDSNHPIHQTLKQEKPEEEESEEVEEVE
ncbi:30S ribosomal protein S4 [archaeon]|nr:30S ribosomal protein S4 [archaeon]